VTWHPTEDVLLSVSYDNTIKVGRGVHPGIDHRGFQIRILRFRV
jgi:hypothetical protein